MSHILRPAWGMSTAAGAFLDISCARLQSHSSLSLLLLFVQQDPCPIPVFVFLMT